MNEKKIYTMQAEADIKHLLSKLNEAESESLEKVAKAEKKITELNVEIEACKSKRDLLRTKFEALKNASDAEWDRVNDELISAIESLEDKSAFRTKTEEWFKGIRETAGGLKTGVKEKIAQW